MSKDIRTQLESLKGHKDMCPRSDWVKQNRSSLLRSITESTHAPKQSSWVFSFQRVSAVFIPQRFAFVTRVLVIGFLSIGMATGGWMVSVSASSKSLPGDLRYGVKLATEKTQVIVAAATRNKESEAELHLEFAERRSDELKQISSEPAQVDKTAKRLKESIASAEKKLNDLKEKEPEKVQEVAKQLNEKTTNIAKNLKDAAKNIDGGEDEQAAEQAVKEVQEAKKIATDAGIGAIQTLVDSASISEEEVKNLVAEKIEAIISETEEVKQNVDVAKGTVISATTSIAIVKPTEAATVSSTDEVSTTTPGGEDIESEEALTFEESVEKVGESVEKTEEVVAEAKELLEGNNVQEAIEKVKILSELTRETEEVLGQVEKVINKEESMQEQKVEEETPATGESTDQASTSTEADVVEQTTES